MLDPEHLRSPHSGLPLYLSSPNILSDGINRYPLFDEIPYLRTGRDELISSVLRAMERGRVRYALCLLLQDQDDWAQNPKPTIAVLDELIDDALSLRRAMTALNFGPVGDYFAYRWSDPTFLSGLALLETHLPRNAFVLELACGIGHYLREFQMRAIAAVGGDVVFAKLWLARKYLNVSSPLVCFDARSPFPFRDGFVNTVFCHDAFYFLPEKGHVASEMKRVSGTTGALLVGHTHCSEMTNFSAGNPLTAEEYLSLFPDSTMYDDDELTASVIEDRRPQSITNSRCAAVALATNPPQDCYRFTSPPVDSTLQLNPLFTGDERSPTWPSKRYEEEYATRSPYLSIAGPIDGPNDDLIRRRVYVSLPECW